MQQRALYQRGLAIYPNRGDRGSIASARQGLGMSAFAEGDYRVAAQFFHDALGLARDIQAEATALIAKSTCAA